MRRLLFLALIALSFTSAIPTFAETMLEQDNIACGDLGYIRGEYVLMADHGEEFAIPEGSLLENELYLTRQLRNIVMNHDYEESDYPQVCFYNIVSERIDINKLNVKLLGSVRLREVIY